MPEGDLLALGTALLAALAITALVFAFVYPYVANERQAEKRYRDVTDTKSRHAAALASAAEQAAVSRRKSVADTLKEIEVRQKAAEKVTLRLRLQRAGIQMSTRMFWLSSVATGMVCAGLAVLLLPPTGIRFFLSIVAGVVGTFGLPRWFLGKATRRRQNKFIAELPNAIDIIVRGMKAGLPFNECLAIITRESQEPLRSEFGEVVEQQRVGVTLAEGLDRLMTRMPLPEVKFLGIVVAIQQQAGGNLTEALGNLAGVLRDRVRLKMKVKALSAEAIASAFVLASLPPAIMLLVYLTSREYLSPLFNTRSGNVLLIFSMVWMTIGVLVMRKMINFKF
jgi:tight adherence protein B